VQKRGRKRRSVFLGEVVRDRKRRAHSGERQAAHVHWRDRMGRYCKEHIAHGGDILDTG
jgi:hypothetical protein